MSNEIPTAELLGERTAHTLGERSAHRQCTATSRNGERCRRTAIVGGFVCSHHGGKAPQVQRSARKRLLAMVDPAMDALLRALESGEPCPHCGRSDADRDPVVLKAAQIVLDRTGYHPTLAVKAGRADDDADNAWAEWIPMERLEQMGRWFDEAQAAMEAGEPSAWSLECAAREEEWAARALALEGEV